MASMATQKLFFPIFTFLFIGTIASLSVKQKALYQPNLKELKSVLKNGLKENFDEVMVKTVQCPDLTVKPFYLASKGLGGSARLIEIGGPPYLFPSAQKDKLYDMRDIIKLVKMHTAFIIGAGAGPYPYINSNCEGIYNLNIVNGTVEQHSRISRVDRNGKPEQLRLPDSESRCAFLANLFFSEGLPGKVIKVHVKKRIGEKDFITSIRTTLDSFYGDKVVGLGGTFLIKKGKALHYIMPDFSETPLVDQESVTKWLHFYNMSSPLTAIGTLVSKDIEELDLRVQHFHSFSQHNEAGHYHYDTTPDIVEYLGYFNIAESIYRIDKPAEHINMDF